MDVSCIVYRKKNVNGWWKTSYALVRVVSEDSR